jgi:hypothetical protein
LVEPYLQTDYNSLSLSDFEGKLLEYSTFLFYNKLKNSVSINSCNDLKIWLKIDTWKYVNLIDLFDIGSTNDNLIWKLTLGWKTPYITSSEMNNWITNYVQEKSNFWANTITANRWGSVGFFFYQPINYLATPVDVRILIPKFKLNSYIWMFLTTIFQKEKFRFNYSRKMWTDRLKELKIKLPFKNWKPDWQFMEEFIKSLPYSVNLK